MGSVTGSGIWSGLLVAVWAGEVCVVVEAEFKKVDVTGLAADGERSISRISMFANWWSRGCRDHVPMLSEVAGWGWELGSCLEIVWLAVSSWVGIAISPLIGGYSAACAGGAMGFAQRNRGLHELWMKWSAIESACGDPLKQASDE